MALTFIQRADSNTNGTASQAVTFGSNVASGNLLVLVIGAGDTGTLINSISDTRGNTYSNRAQASGNDGTSLKIFTYDCVSVGAGPNTVTVNIDRTTFLELVVWEFHTTSGTWTYDQGGVSSGSANPATSGPVTTTQAAEVMVGYGMLFGTPGAYASGWTGTNTASGDGSAYNIVSVAGSNTFTVAQGSVQRYMASIATYYASGGGGTPVNATVAIAAKAVSGLTPLQRVTHNATFICQAGAAGTFRGNLGVFGHAILQGRSTATTYTARNTRNQTAPIASRATGTFNVFLTQSATVHIAGTASASFFIPGTAPNVVNATVHIFAFAANNIVIGPFAGRATLMLRASIPTYVLAINGRATLTPLSFVTRNLTRTFAGRATLTLTAQSTGGSGMVNGTVVINGRGGFTNATARLIQNGQVLIEAGNPLFTFAFGHVNISARAGIVTLAPKVTHSSTLAIRGTAVLQPFGLIQGNLNIFGVTRIAGRASLTASIASTNVLAFAIISGTASLSPVQAPIFVSVSATVAISAKAAPRFAAFTQGSTFSNAVLTIHGQSVFTPLAFDLVQPSILFSGTATLTPTDKDIIRAIAFIRSFANFRPSIPKKLLQWSAVRTTQYKVWQYNMESTVRVLGTSWVVSGVGLTFQSVAMELISTEAGWGDK